MCSYTNKMTAYMVPPPGSPELQGWWVGRHTQGLPSSPPEGCLTALPAWPPPGSSEQAAMLTTAETPRNVARGTHGVGSLPGLVWGGVVHLSQAASSC